MNQLNSSPPVSSRSLIIISSLVLLITENSKPSKVDSSRNSNTVGVTMNDEDGNVMLSIHPQS